MGKAVDSVVDVVGDVVGGVADAAGDVVGSVTGANAVSEADKQARRIAEEQATLARNMSADLGIDNTARVEAAGTAEEFEDRRKRPRKGSSVSTSLGLNV